MLVKSLFYFKKLSQSVAKFSFLKQKNENIGNCSFLGSLKTKSKYLSTFSACDWDQGPRALASKGQLKDQGFYTILPLQPWEVTGKGRVRQHLSFANLDVNCKLFEQWPENMETASHFNMQIWNDIDGGIS